MELQGKHEKDDQLNGEFAYCVGNAAMIVVLLEIITPNVLLWVTKHTSFINLHTDSKFQGILKKYVKRTSCS